MKKKKKKKTAILAAGIILFYCSSFSVLQQTMNELKRKGRQKEDGRIKNSCKKVFKVHFFLEIKTNYLFEHLLKKKKEKKTADFCFVFSLIYIYILYYI